jgi:DNA-binding NtrC family response regulator
MSKVSILIIDGDPESRAALWQVLESDEWNTGVAPAGQALRELAGGNWALIVANVATTGTSGLLYSTLKELAFAPALESGKARARVLFVVPESDAPQIQPLLERERLPYTLRPFVFHDFLEKISDLLLETESIAQPIRRVRQEGKSRSERFASSSSSQLGPGTGRGREINMFANRDDYPMTEEEIAAYEREEAAEIVRKKKKKDQRTQLG